MEVNVGRIAGKVEVPENHSTGPDVSGWMGRGAGRGDEASYGVWAVDDVR
jgi:hypothetical protein